MNRYNIRLSRRHKFQTTFHDFARACSLAARINLLSALKEKDDTAKGNVENLSSGGRGLVIESPQWVASLDQPLNISIEIC